MRRAALLLGVVLVAGWLALRGPRAADAIRHVLEPAHPPGIPLVLDADGTIEIGGRRMRVEGGMGVDCMPSVNVPAFLGWCRGPGFAAGLRAKMAFLVPELPRFIHARVESGGETWETPLREHERGFDRFIDVQYVGAAAARLTPEWQGGRPITVTLWLEHEDRVYEVRLPPSEIRIAM